MESSAQSSTDQVKNKYIVKITTPLGVYLSNTKDLSSSELDQFTTVVQRNLDYMTFEDQDGNTVIIKKEALANSVIVFVKVPSRYYDHTN